jgi:hypothetical protein
MGEAFKSVCSLYKCSQRGFPFQDTKICRVIKLYVQAGQSITFNGNNSNEEICSGVGSHGAWILGSGSGLSGVCIWDPTQPMHTSSMHARKISQCNLYN